MTERDYDKIIKKAGLKAIEKLEKDTLNHLDDKPVFKSSKKFEKNIKKIIRKNKNRDA